ncbi:MAG: hypothetical protein NZ874_01525 [Fimbriimonadales bacterium]|nr:hypothetical protein [Fimbriimonadales bacterium]
MEIPKPVGIGIIVIVAILAFALVWYLASGSGGASSTVKESAYPEYKSGPRLPESELKGPPEPLPIAGSGGRR